MVRKTPSWLARAFCWQTAGTQQGPDPPRASAPSWWLAVRRRGALRGRLGCRQEGPGAGVRAERADGEAAVRGRPVVSCGRGPVLLPQEGSVVVIPICKRTAWHRGYLPLGAEVPGGRTGAVSRHPALWAQQPHGGRRVAGVQARVREHFRLSCVVTWVCGLVKTDLRFHRNRIF